MTPTNINFNPKKYAGAVGLDRSPSPGFQACTGWETCPASLAPSLGFSTKKTSGTGVKRTPNVRLRLRFVVVNFGQIQLFSVKFNCFRSNSFCHLNLVKLITLFILVHKLFFQIISNLKCDLFAPTNFFVCEHSFQ